MPVPPSHIPADDARLENTKMSFGAHLEELRNALIKSLAVTVVGFLIGLTMGWAVVRFIQTPLRSALETYYRDHAEVALLKRLEGMRRDGLPVPEDLDATAAQMADDGLVPLNYYIDPNELRRALGSPATAPGRAAPPAATNSATGPSPDSASPDSASPDSTSPDATSPDATGASKGLPSAEKQMEIVPSRLKRSDLVQLHVYQPLEEDVRLRVVGLNVTEGFMVYVKASLMVGVLISSPFVFYFIWDFVAAGLYRHEKKHIYIYLPMSLGLFLAGASLAFFVVFDYVLNFLFWFYTKMGIDPDPRISEWISFVLMLPLGFGISFQLPLVMLFLERIGVFTVEAYQQKWRVAILVISVLSMFLTPADPGSMLLMGIPLIVLYFGGIGLCRFMPRNKPEFPEPDAGMNTSGS